MKDRLNNFFYETGGWISNILIFFPVFAAVFLSKIFGLYDLFTPGPSEELP